MSLTLLTRLLLLALTVVWIESSTNSLDSLVPSLHSVMGYVTSTVCQECHKAEHQSWHKSYHRTMTQLAKPENLQAKFDGTEINSDGLKYRVFSKGDELWAEMPDPDMMMYVVQGGRQMPLGQIPRIEARVLMATGSHHYHTFWVGSQRYPKLMQTLPLVYMIEEKKWVPREAAFMRGDNHRFITQWNHHCIRCHSTGGNPGLNETTGLLETTVAEYGIACEACHGPGEKHVALRRSEKLQEIRQVLNDPIVNPAKLDSKRSSQVCGQCHGVFINKDEFAMQYAHEGVDYFPGDDLERARYYIQHPGQSPNSQRVADLKRNPTFFSERWWDDGTILAGGREFTGLSASKCYTKGQISCLSCHSMHDSDPNDQLKRFATDNHQCIQCHKEPQYTTDVSSHTYHRESSSGSNCLNCHMPHSTYALLKGIRSHQISSPKVEASAVHGTPNACNLCHLDKTLAWTQEHLGKRYKIPLVPLTTEQQTVATSVLWLTKGNAAQRVIASWHLGWPPAQTNSATGWMPPYLALLLNDPYGVVRYISGRSLRSVNAYGTLDYDFMSPLPERTKRVNSVLQQWGSNSNQPNSALLINSQGQWDTERVKEFLRLRDNRPITIKE